MADPSHSKEETAPVRIVDYDLAWPRMYADESRRILNAIGSVVVAVEHIGSTAVPGLGAKPVIDLLVGVHSLEDAAACVAPLTALGYEYVPEFEDAIPDRRYFRKGPPEARLYHLHMAEFGTAFWERLVLFRDYLRVHPEAARQYERLKRRLAAKYGRDRVGYNKAKTTFILEIESKAREERARHDAIEPQPC